MHELAWLCIMRIVSRKTLTPDKIRKAGKRGDSACMIRRPGCNFFCHPLSWQMKLHVCKENFVRICAHDLSMVSNLGSLPSYVVVFAYVMLAVFA